TAYCPTNLLPYLPYSPQLIRIAHDIDADDLSVADVERRRLERLAGFDGDEARQAVDEGVAHEPRSVLGEELRQGAVHFHHRVEAQHRLHGSRFLAATVRVHRHLRGEQPSQCRHVAAA